MTSENYRVSSRVAHVFSRMDPGGAELRTIEVVNRTRKTFDFVTVSGKAGQLDDQLAREGHRVHRESMSLVGLVRIGLLFRRNRFDVVHSHLGAASGPVLLIATLCGVGVRIAHFRSDGVGGRASARRSLLLKVSRGLVNLCATRIVGVSPGSLTWGWREGWKRDRRCAVIPNGLDARALRQGAAPAIAQRPRALEHLVVINIGRAEPSKNRGRAVRIWAQLAAERPSTLLVVGEVNAADRLEIDAAAERVLPASRIVETGDSRDVPLNLGSAHVLLVTSTREGLPGVVLESLAIGVPVVASELPGTEWIASEVTSGVTLCDLGDVDSRWVRALLDAADQSDRADIQSRFDEAPFTIGKVVPMFEHLWRFKVRAAGE